MKSFRTSSSTWDWRTHRPYRRRTTPKPSRIQQLSGWALLLVLPDFSRTFEIKCDSSGIMIRGVLMQDERPITYHRETLDSAVSLIPFMTKNYCCYSCSWDLARLPLAKTICYTIGKWILEISEKPIIFEQNAHKTGWVHWVFFVHIKYKKDKGNLTHMFFPARTQPYLCAWIFMFWVSMRLRTYKLPKKFGTI
jgi:hypothetical protein